MKFFLHKYAAEAVTQDESDVPTNKQVKNRPQPKVADRSTELAESLGFTRLIGRGQYGQAFAGQYGDTPAVIKIETPMLEKPSNEISNAQKMIALRRAAPAEVKKNLPKIYIAKQIDYRGVKYNIIIMEQLAQLSESIKSLFRSGDKADSLYIAKTLEQKQERTFEPDTEFLHSVFNNTEFINKLSDVFLTFKAPNSFSNIDQYEETDLRAELKNAFPSILHIVGEEIVSQLNSEKVFTVSMLEYQFKELLKTAVSQAVSSEANELFKQIPEAQIDILFKKIMTVSKIPLFAPETPMEKVQIQLDPKSYEGKLVRALNWLFDHGLAWADLHNENALYRESSDDIVVIDFGLYQQIL